MSKEIEKDSMIIVMKCAEDFNQDQYDLTVEAFKRVSNKKWDELVEMIEEEKKPSCEFYKDMGYHSKNCCHNEHIHNQALDNIITKLKANLRRINRMKEIKLTKSQAILVYVIIDEQIDYYVKKLQNRGFFTKKGKVNKTIKKPYMDYNQGMIDEIKRMKVIKEKLGKEYNI